jgi:hypothetical protein
MTGDDRAVGGRHVGQREGLGDEDPQRPVLSAIADTLRAALDAGCTDLIECAGQPQCPLPLAALAGEKAGAVQLLDAIDDALDALEADSGRRGAPPVLQRWPVGHPG